MIQCGKQRFLLNGSQLISDISQEKKNGTLIYFCFYITGFSVQNNSISLF